MPIASATSACESGGVRSRVWPQCRENHRHRASAEHGLEGTCHHFDADAQVGRLGAVDVYAQFRLVQPQVDVHALDARVLGDLVQHLARDAVQVFVAVGSLDDEVQRPLAEALPQRGRRDRERAHAWQRTDFAEYTFIELSALRLLPIARPRQHGPRRDHAIGRESGWRRLHANEGADQKSGADEQHDRYRDLRGDQSIAHAR